MSGSADEFAQNAPGVSSAESVREGAFIHVYEGTLESEESVRFLTLAPDIDDEDAAEAFTRTAGQWYNANTHPNTVSVSKRDDEPRPWIAVADVTGQPLDAVQPSLPPAETKTIISDVAEALRNAVLYNTYHLDLRPDHIWVVPDEEGVTGLVDEWGLERAVRVAVGEPDVTPFTAPEVVEDAGAGGEQTDVYGLGALAYFGLTGQPPITAGADLASAITDGDIAPPSEVDGSLSPAIDEIVMEALATDPADRPDSAYSFKQAFAQAFSPDEESEDDDSAAAGGAAAGATGSDGEGADDQPETDDESMVSRRAALGMLGVGVVVVGGGWMAAQNGGNDDESAAATVPTETPTETETPIDDDSETDGENVVFRDRFESGQLTNWNRWKSAEWQSTENALFGAYSAYCDASGDTNLFYTTDPVSDFSEPFEISYVWKTSDPDSRGLDCRLIHESSETDIDTLFRFYVGTDRDRRPRIRTLNEEKYFSGFDIVKQHETSVRYLNNRLSVIIDGEEIWTVDSNVSG